MRSEFYITKEKEEALLERLSITIRERYPELNPTNTLLLMVSPDYSANVAMRVAHDLSQDGEMLDILPIDVPYPDEDAKPFQAKAYENLLTYFKYSGVEYKNYLLVEAGIIRGGNYGWLVELLSSTVTGNIITTAMFENIYSKFKSDIVMEYYNDPTQDLTFYFEKYNKHWI